MKLLLSLVMIAFMTSAAFAGDRGDVSVSLSLGDPVGSVLNPDDTYSYYEGIGIDAKLYIPVMYGSDSNLSLTFNYKYFDLDNTTESSINESAGLTGPGLGFDISFHVLSLGASAEFLQMEVEQSSSSGTTKQKYDFMNISYYAGLIKHFKNFQLGVLYSIDTATISKDDTGADKDSDFENKTIWLTLKFDLD
ncbi:MAG: hypothetical protein KDD37_10515, partial [Bdellovibrionales bacterium]|nr:hypothetical protein [Bdellovibrionales bacterium]